MHHTTSANTTSANTTSASTTTVNIRVHGGQIAVSPDPVPVRGADQSLLFQLLSAGYSFPKAGAIVVSGGHKGQFPHAPVWVDAQTVRLHDCNSNTAACSYKYTVTVLDGQGQPITLDPTIDNEGKGGGGRPATVQAADAA